MLTGAQKSSGSRLPFSVSYIRRERILRMRQFLAGKLSLAPRWTGRPLAGKNCLQITTRFHGFLAYSALALFFSSLKYNEHAVKSKKETLGSSRRKKIFLLSKKAITDLLDKCVTSAGVSRLF